MCRATAGPLLAMVGVAGTMAGVAIAIVREKVDRRADARAAKQAAEEQDASDDRRQYLVNPDSGETNFVADRSGKAGAGDRKSVEKEPAEARLDESKPGDV